jgi:hypothetical protein
MAKAKTVNYTPEQIEVLKAGYTGADNAAEVEALSKTLGKSPASVRAKLASLDLYKSKEKDTTEGETVTKIVLAESIGKAVELLEAEVEGLSKAPKTALAKILAKLA